jgi:hypothetical protein
LWIGVLRFWSTLWSLSCEQERALSKESERHQQTKWAEGKPPSGKLENIFVSSAARSLLFGLASVSVRTLRADKRLVFNQLLQP